MLRLAADENVPFAIVRGLRQRQSDLDLVHVLELGMQATPDPDLLAWAAAEGRVFISYDRQTMIGFAYDRVRASQLMAGLIVVAQDTPIGRVIDDILLLALATEPAEWVSRVEYVPL